MDISWTLDGEFGGDYKNAYFDVIEGAVDFIVPNQDTIEGKAKSKE